MIRWSAVVPLKLGPHSKSRLAAILSPESRQQLVIQMAEHVVAALRAAGSIAEVLVIGTAEMPNLPARFFRDRGRGLNAELDDLAMGIPTRLLVIHGDLPCVEPIDIAALLVAAESSGCAIAPDRHGEGTNALALCEVPTGFRFAFGKGSFAAHQHSLGAKLTIVERAGLACDIDTPADFEFAISRGCFCSLRAS